MEDKEKSGNYNSLDTEFENQLRPSSFSDFSGQKNIISNLVNNLLQLTYKKLLTKYFLL